MALEYKQKGTPDVNHKGYKSYGKGRRFAGVLQPQERWVQQPLHKGSSPAVSHSAMAASEKWQEGVLPFLLRAIQHIPCLCACRCAFHWDNINEARLLVIRPAAPGWPWSGAFPLPEREDYFGLRLRNR
jgi:hypothetical protein